MKDGFTVFLHLSDIHFWDKRTGSLDLDAEVRNELERDCVRVKNEIGSADAILVTGDIGYAGLPEEYDRATEWLARLADQIDCRSENTFVAPGNHDVDRSVVSKSEVSRMIRNDLRQCGVEAIDNLLAKKLADPEATTTLYRPLQNYNEFASRFRCDIGPNRDWWESNFRLNDGSTLRVRGLNSTLVSDASDNNTNCKLLLGSFQCQFMQDDGAEYMTLCHHPPQWLRDEDNVAAILKARVRIQLFGHKHKQVLDRINGTLRLTAGAVHPDRQEDEWEPRYNWLAVRVDGTGKQRKLVVKVYPRVWHDGSREFVADHQEDANVARQFEFDLKAWYRPDSTREIPAGSPADEPESELVPDEGGAAVDPRRTLTYRYYGLAFNIRLGIAQSLGLVEDEDRNVVESELFRRIFQRAAERSLLEKLWGEVEAKYEDGPTGDNPFKGI